MYTAEKTFVPQLLEDGVISNSIINEVKKLAFSITVSLYELAVKEIL